MFVVFVFMCICYHLLGQTLQSGCAIVCLLLMWYHIFVVYVFMLLCYHMFVAFVFVFMCYHMFVAFVFVYVVFCLLVLCRAAGPRHYNHNNNKCHDYYIIII